MDLLTRPRAGLGELRFTGWDAVGVALAVLLAIGHEDQALSRIGYATAVT